MEVGVRSTRQKARAHVSEIVPSVDAASRAYMVKSRSPDGLPNYGPVCLGAPVFTLAQPEACSPYLHLRVANGADPIGIRSRKWNGPSRMVTLGMRTEDGA